MKVTRLSIEATWDGHAIGADEQVAIDLILADTRLNVEIDAPFHNDPRPNAAAGSFDGLWDYEVVELFLRGDGDIYLELEFGPLGHFLALSLDGYRERQTSGLAIDYECSITGPRWTGRAAIPATYLPAGMRSCNAYAIHGSGNARRYLAVYPSGGREPDFHQLESFRPLSWQELR